LVSGGDSKNSPIAKKLLDLITEFLPSPLDLPPVEGINPKNQETVVRHPKDTDPLAALVFKVVTDSHVGTLAYVRIYSGSLKPGSYVWNSSTDKKERVSRLMLMHANHREDIDELKAGEIGAVIGLKDSTTGHTLSDDANPIVLESINFPEPVIAASVEPKTKQDADKLSMVLQKVAQEDPTFKVRIDHETGQTIIAGMGQFHLIVLTERMEREYGLQLTLGEPKVAYRESIEEAVKAEGKFVKQSGGKGQYGHCWLRLEPRERGEGFEFADETKGGSIPREFIPAIEKGIREGLLAGTLMGYPVVDIRAAVYDGSYHDVDSSEAAFKMAGLMAFREGQKKAKPYLLEPIMHMEVVVPEEFLGSITGILSSKRAQIQTTYARKEVQVVEALIPLAETFDFSTKLRAATSGRGSSYLEFSHYDRVPSGVLAKMLENK
jgi:elongation factor G